MIKYFKFIFILGISWFIVHELIITYDGLSDEKVKSDAIVVLGNKVNEDGTLSKRLEARLETALELYKDSLAPFIFVSGGLGKEGHLEGSKMADYLIENGVNKKHLVIDNLGNTTQLTADNFYNLYPNLNSIIVVSQFYHISRIKLAFKKKGFKAIYGVHCNYFEFRDSYGLFREFFGYYKYLLF